MEQPSALTAEALLAHVDWMRALAYKLVNDPGRAEDLLQDSLVAAVQKPPRNATNLRGWLRTVITNGARQLVRTESRRRTREAAGARPEALPSTVELVGQAELTGEVVAAVLALKEPYRSTILLRFYRGHTPAQIAAMQELPAATVRTHLRRGLEQLRTELDRKHGGDRREWCSALAPLWRPASASPAALVAAPSVLFGLVAKVGASLALLSGMAGVGWILSRPAATVPTPVAAGQASADNAGARERADPGPNSSSGAERPPVPNGAADRQAKIETEVRFGRISRPNGDPVVDATLVFYAELPEGEAELADVSPVAGSRTDTEGRFHVSLPSGAHAKAMAVEEDGLTKIWAVLPEPGEPADVTVGWDMPVRALVTDAATGEPIPDAHVAIAGVKGRSDELGRCRLEAVRAEERVQFVVHHPGYVRIDEYRTLDRASDRALAIELERGSRMAVTVVDALSGEALPGARVTACGNSELPLATADEEGRFEMSVLEARELSITVRHPGHARFSWSWMVTDTAALASVRIPMRALGWIEGRVYDEAGSAVVATVSAAIQKQDGSGTDARFPGLPGRVKYAAPSRRAGVFKTRADGSFAIPVVTGPSPYRVRARKEGYLSGSVEGLLVSSASERPRAEIQLRTGGSLYGVVRYNGAPWSDGRLCCDYEDGTSRGSVPIDRDGRYVMPSVEPGLVRVRVLFGRSRGIPDPPPVLVVAGESIEHDISWSEELLPVQGSVRNADGSPASGLDVTASGRGAGGARRSFSTEVTPEGAFELKVIPGLAYRIGAARGSARVEARDVLAGSEGVDLVLPQVGRVRLRLVDARTGRRVNLTDSDAYSLAWRASGTELFSRISGTTDGDCVELELPAGSIDLSLFPGSVGYAPRQVLGIPVSESVQELAVVEIPLEPGVACKLELTGQIPAWLHERSGPLFLLHDQQEVRGPFPEMGLTNQRIRGVNVWIGEPGLREQLVKFDRTGRVHMKGLRPGRYRLRAFPDDLRFEPEEFELDPAAASPVTIELRCRER